jgi:hypothetical protein
MILQALETLPTLVKGGLQLDERTESICIDFSVTPDGMAAPKEWMKAKHYNVLYCMPGDHITSLNLQNANAAEAMVLLTKAIKKGSMQSLSELDLSKNELDAKGAKVVAESLKVDAQMSWSVCE